MSEFEKNEKNLTGSEESTEIEQDHPEYLETSSLPEEPEQKETKEEPEQKRESLFIAVVKALPVAAKRYLKKKTSAGTLITFAICLAIILFGRWANLVRVVGDSMNPTYVNGNILYTRINDVDDKEDIRYYDVVVCDLDDREDSAENIRGHKIIKRAVGLPGDTIQVVDGYLYRNGEKVTEEYERMAESGIAAEEVVLGKDEFFVIGDNRNNSYDSRFIGVIKENEIENIVRGRIPFF